MKASDKKVLFLPFLQIPSGHHQVANTVMGEIQQSYSHVSCENVNILAYTYGWMEKVISSIYLRWIRLFPKIYNVIYRKAVYQSNHREKRYLLYELLFLRSMKRLMVEKNPDLIVCTHSLPAYMLNHLKKNDELQIPVINIYTDYFIHQFWGTKYIDYHFAPNIHVKSFLLEKGVSEKRIFVTGIPVHREIKKQQERQINPRNNSMTLLIAGGNLGVGALKSLIDELRNVKNIKLYVLCGKNKRLYKRVKALRLDYINPYSYINSMGEMNALYEEADAIITKPGGVTISECLYKKIPIFIYHSLPGQEKINLHELKKQGLIFQIKKGNICEQIQSILFEKSIMEDYRKQLGNYHSNILEKRSADIIKELLLMEGTYKDLT